MPACDYCAESFDDEDAYLDHLAAAHEGDLGRIDRRRVADHEGEGEDDGAIAFGPAVLVGLLVIAGGIVVYVTFLMGGSGGDTGTPADATARSIPDDPLLDDAESFPSQGRSHVSSGSTIDYERVPPLSGTHYGSWAEAGFYEETPPLGRLVHSLEHGHVVIYYDPAALTPAARENLTSLATTYTGPWSSVIVAPHPNESPESAYLLTAWQVRQSMDSYDQATVEAFLDAFRGRGPENAVR